MEIKTLEGYLATMKTAIDLLKTAACVLPKRDNADNLKIKILGVERAFEESRIELAKLLGYELCKCTFPPQIMLWREIDEANTCSLCGHQISQSTMRIGEFN